MFPLTMQPLHEAIKFAICLWGEPSKEVRNMLACNVLSFQDVLDEGAAAAAGFQMANIQRNDLATFVYTSGTTGNPKVHLTMLSQACTAMATCSAGMLSDGSRI